MISVDLPTAYQKYIHRSRYARYLPELKRRETWEETVDRYFNFFKQQESKYTTESMLAPKVRNAILNLDVMPSMRAMMTAGTALERDNVAGYNCAYVAVDNPRVFDEILYILMCGTGVGFSVERQYIQHLPEVAEEFYNTDTLITVADSKIGWATAFRELISLLYNGKVPSWDLSKLRPAGAVLKTFGGRSSGPGPLNQLFSFCVEVFKQARGRRLTSIEAHDIICKIADIVVCGGVRRSALISLSNLTDERMRHAKDGQFWIANPHRSLANNSVCYTEKPDLGIFMREWQALYQSRSGERGIFARYACDKHLPSRRAELGYKDYGTNPCSEIVLRSKQFCNLTEVVIRPNDSLDILKYKVESATILGTIQSAMTDFRYISKQWKANCELERLLGVSLTGIATHPVLSNPTEESARWLTALRDHAVKVNKNYAAKLGINQATSITCVKPSGTVSQLVNTSSGIHQPFSDYYIRRVRADIKDPLCASLLNANVPHEIDINNPGAYVFSFPTKGNKSHTKNPDALGQLELWAHYDKYWCEHKPSCTIMVEEHEWLDVASWVFRKFDDISGISFFPKDNHIYPQAPYEAITEAHYKELMQTFPLELDFNIGEESDSTTASQELACTGNQCEIV